ncbi:MAG: hypothetical protein WCO52_02490 [bacterium]
MRDAEPAPQLRRRYRLVCLLIGASIIVLSLIAQWTTTFTPFLSQYPFLLQAMGSIGLFAVAVCTVLYGVLNAYLKRGVYRLLLWLGAIELVLILLTPLGTALQLTLAGLTIGGSLIVLGGASRRFTRKQ